MLLVRLSDPAYQTDLIVFLRNSGVDGVTRNGGDVEVAGLGEERLAKILDTWRSLHPDLSTEVVR
jgi:hypothetical protein